MEVDKNIKANKGRWSFGGDVPESFVNHIEKSVPYYHEGHDLVVDLSRHFVRSDSTCLEVGTSTGALLEKLAVEYQTMDGVQFIGCDNEEAMVEVAKNKLKKFNNVIIEYQDIIIFNMPKCDLIVSYYTIQFIHPKFRQNIMDKIHESLNWGGGFLMFEKIRAPDARFQDINTNYYNNFKLNKGFSESQILNKTKSLSGILEPFSEKANIDMMKRAGFSDINSIFKWVNFEGILAIK